MRNNSSWNNHLHRAKLNSDAYRACAALAKHEKARERCRIIHSGFQGVLAWRRTAEAKSPRRS